VEASMLVTGLIAVNADGGVYSYSLDERDKLPAGVINLIKGTVSEWKFEPVKVNGKPVFTKALMSLRIVARQNSSGQYQARVEGASFARDTAQSLKSPECANDACLTPAYRRPPAYPLELLQDRVSGTAYVVLRVNREGRVTDAAIRQIDLRNIADEIQLKRWRLASAHASLAVVSDWKFNIPTTGDEANKDDWVVSVPINYLLDGITPQLTYGKWDAYVPGPVQKIPWAEDDANRTPSNRSADAIPDNGTAFIADCRFVLLTPPSPG
ncbi:MAG: energy transducer TonB, partial [Rhodanobacteraceae bacterium]